MAHLIIIDAAPPVVTYRSDNSINSSGGNHTHSGLSFGPAASDRVLFALVMSGSSTAIGSVTIGGVAATRAIQAVSPSNVNWSEIWVASVPTGTSGSVVLTNASSSWASCVGIYSATGLLSTTATDTNGTGALGSATISTSVAVQAQGIVLAVASNNLASSGVSWTGPTAGYATTFVSFSSGASYTATNATTLGVSAAFTGNQYNSLAVAAFR